MKARAKRKDNGDFIEGKYCIRVDGYTITQNCIQVCVRNAGGVITKISTYEVDPTTIEYEVNGEWLSEEEVQNRCAITKNLCEDQKEWIETTNHLKEEAERLRAEVDRLDSHISYQTR